MTGVPNNAKSWLNVSVPWYNDPSRWDVMLAASGPSQWARVSAGDPNPPLQPVDPVQVSGIKTSDDRISFDVDRTGSPVLVKTSYFPNWQATGAKGPWRVTPNLMVVIPTSHHVSLHYGFTPIDGLGWTVTALGLAYLIWMARHPLLFRGPRRSRGIMDDELTPLEGDGVAEPRQGAPPEEPVPAPTGRQREPADIELENALKRISALSPLPWSHEGPRREAK
jgi:hypothetical protein